MMYYVLPHLQQAPSSYWRRPISYYPFPNHTTFNPYHVELPNFQQPTKKWTHCKKHCYSMGIIPNSVAWQQCMSHCTGVIGKLLDDPQFIEDME